MGNWLLFCDKTRIVEVSVAMVQSEGEAKETQLWPIPFPFKQDSSVFISLIFWGSGRISLGKRFMQMDNNNLKPLIWDNNNKKCL